MSGSKQTPEAADVIELLSGLLSTLEDNPALQRKVPVSFFRAIVTPGELEYTIRIASPTLTLNPDDSILQVEQWDRIEPTLGELCDSILRLLEEVSHRAPNFVVMEPGMRATLRNMLGMFEHVAEPPPPLSAQAQREVREVLLNVSLAGFNAAGLRELAARALVRAEHLEAEESMQQAEVN